MESAVGTAPEAAVILPTYCEARNIEGLIREIEDLGLNLLLFVIDDSSPDGTAETVRRLQREYPNILLLVRSTKLGLGTAITDGFKAILSSKNPPSYVVTMDADYSHNPKDIRRLLRIAKKGCDLVIGSRYCKGGKTVNWSFIRLVISKIANFVASEVIGAKVRDCTSGLRCYSTSFIRSILPELHSQTYEIQIETVRQACLRGLRIKEVPITFTNRKEGKSKLTPNEIKQFFSYIIRAKLDQVFAGWKRRFRKGVDE